MIYFINYRFKVRGICFEMFVYGYFFVIFYDVDRISDVFLSKRNLGRNFEKNVFFNERLLFREKK